jgi:hypothetical protein
VMEYFSVNAFYLGVFLFTCMFMSTVFYSLFCLIWKVKIIEFGIFSNPYFSIHKEKILGTEFILGWLPYGCHIRPLGMLADNHSKAEIHQADLPFALFSKPIFLRYVFYLTPIFVYSLSFFVVINFSLFGLIDETSYTLNFSFEVLREMFSASEHRADFMVYAKEIFEGRNHVLFTFLVVNILFLVFSIPMVVLNFLNSIEKISERLKEIMQYLYVLFSLWFMVWKIPSFIFSFFELPQGLIYFFSFLTGMFATGFVCFYTTLYVVKGVAKHLSERKFQ